jgi:hypothetical protein
MWIEATLSVALLLCAVQLWFLLRAQDSQSHTPSLGLPRQQPKLIQPMRPTSVALPSSRRAAVFVKSRLASMPNDRTAPRELQQVTLPFNCTHGAEHFDRLVKLGKAQPTLPYRRQYQAHDSVSNVTGVLSVPNVHHDNATELTLRELALLMHTEADLLLRLQHPNIVRLYGACFDTTDPKHMFTFVESVQHWAPTVLRQATQTQISPLQRVAMARGIAELVRTWNHGTNGLGVPLLHCDFVPQQFGVDDAGAVKLLDVEGLRELPSNTSAFFFDLKCDSDSTCRRTGCDNGGKPGHNNFRNSWTSFDPNAIDEVRCDENTRRCVGMGIEYNVFAMCRHLLLDLFAPSATRTAAAALMRGCLEPTIAKRWTIDQVLDELRGIERQLKQQHQQR